MIMDASMMFNTRIRISIRISSGRSFRIHGIMSNNVNICFHISTDIRIRADIRISSRIRIRSHHSFT